jgi:hypothetical protein
MMKDIAANNQSEMLNGEIANPTEEQQTISTVPTNGTQEEEVPDNFHITVFAAIIMRKTIATSTP